MIKNIKYCFLAFVILPVLLSYGLKMLWTDEDTTISLCKN